MFVFETSIFRVNELTFDQIKRAKNRHPRTNTHRNKQVSQDSRVAAKIHAAPKNRLFPFTASQVSNDTEDHQKKTKH